MVGVIWINGKRKHWFLGSITEYDHDNPDEAMVDHTLDPDRRVLELGSRGSFLSQNDIKTTCFMYFLMRNSMELV